MPHSDPLPLLGPLLSALSHLLSAAGADALTAEQAALAGTPAQRDAMCSALASMGFGRPRPSSARLAVRPSRMRSGAALAQTLRQLHAMLAGRATPDGRYLERVDGRPVAWRVGRLEPDPAALERIEADARRLGSDPAASDW